MMNDAKQRACYQILIISLLILFYSSAFGAAGSAKWAFHTSKDIISSPALGPDGTIYVGSNDSNLYAINPDGSLKWVFDTGIYEVFSSPAVGADGTIYVGSESKKLYAINPDGTEKWEFITSLSGVGSSPTLGPDGTIYIGAGQKFYAINPDGTKKWETAIDFSCADMAIGSSAAIAKDGTLYVGSCSGSSGGLYAVSPSGVQKWKFTTPNNVQASPAIGSDGTIYVGSTVGIDWGKFYAIKPDGSLKWSIPANDIVSSAAIGADGTIYVSTANTFAAINQDGTVKWDSPADVSASSPAIGNDGTLYIAGWYDRLFAFSPDGIQKWVYVPEDSYVGSISSPVIGKDGTVYVGLGSTLYAIESDSGGLGHVQWPMVKHDTRHSGTLDPHDHFVVSDIAPAQQTGMSIPLTIAAQDSSHNSIVTYNRPTRLRGFTGSKENYFSEDFEDGDYDGWLDGKGQYQRTVTSDISAEGSYSFSLKGPFLYKAHRNGIAFNYKNPQAPGDISFYVRSSATNLDSGYFVLGPAYHCPILFYMKKNGKFYANFDIEATYQANVWYKVQFVFDWDNFTFDLYINDSLVYAGIAFNNFVSSFSSLYLYNGDNSQAWWDKIEFNGNARSPVSITPTTTTAFSSGVWGGNINVTNKASNMFIVVDDGSGHFGISNQFNVTNDGLSEIIMSLRMLSDISSDDFDYTADINGDGKIGLAEVIHIMRRVSGLIVE